MEEIKPSNGEPVAQTPPTDIKVAEIWIKNSQLYLEGSADFWQDRIRALGLLEMCKEIVKTAQPPSEKKIITSPRMSPMDFMRSKFKRKR